ncbi:MAG: hypothetical protein LBH90_06720 [Tannerella sp.]|nr:hypothetical protein [Tannerella sp.]
MLIINQLYSNEDFGFNREIHCYSGKDAFNRGKGIKRLEKSLRAGE